jgi:Tfp pilus assembly protein PilF
MAIKHDPRSFYAYNNLGVALQLKGNFAEAISYYEDALRINSFDAEVLFNLGTALIKVNNL